MKTILVFAILVFCVVLSECKQRISPSRDETTIEWNGEFRLDKANYFINGNKAGVGLVGFETVMAHLETLDRAASVKIRMPKKWSSMGYDGVVNQWWEFPFEGYPDQEKRFTQLCGEKSLTLSFESID